MPVFQVDIEKSFSPTTGTTVYWTNVYHVNVADQAAAVTAGNSIVALEKTIHSGAVNFTKMRVRQSLPLAQAGSIVPLTGAGQRTNTNPLPLFNVFRVDFSVSSGRPSRKYLRGPVLSADSTATGLASATTTLIQNSYSTPLLNMNVVVDPQGQPFQSAAVWPFVAMRQLRRGSKRKVTPVI